jgi:hypothetical protein
MLRVDRATRLSIFTLSNPLPAVRVVSIREARSPVVLVPKDHCPTVFRSRSGNRRRLLRSRGMRFEIRHPQDTAVSAWYGFDHAVGFFVTIERNEEQIAAYDAITKGYNVERPLLGALRFMVMHGFFGADDLDAALLALERDEPARGRVRIAADVVANFKAAAD